MVLLSAWWLSPITTKSWSSQPIIPSMPEKKQKQLEHNILFDCMGLFGQKNDTVPYVIQCFETLLFPKKCNSAANNHAHVHHLHTFPTHFPTFSIYKMALRSIHQLPATTHHDPELISKMLLELVQSAPIALRAKAKVHPCVDQLLQRKSQKAPKTPKRYLFLRVKLARSVKNKKQQCVGPSW